MNTIKNLIYLDEYKMYSLASQMFRGVTESVVKYDATTSETHDQQTGNIFSGRSMSDLLVSASSTQERKYLHDYAYTTFENELEESGKMVRVSNDNVERTIHQVSGTKFVAVRGKITFHDVDAIRNLLSNFNGLGEAVAYVSTFPHISEEPPDAQTRVGGSRNRGGQSKRSGSNSRLDTAKEVAKKKGMALDPTYLKKIGELLDLGYEGLFYVSLDVGQYLFTATVQRQYFREPEELIVRKYSRSSDQEFVLVGSIAQGPKGADANPGLGSVKGIPDLDSEVEPDNQVEITDLRDAIEIFTGVLHEFDEVFAGKKENEIVLDPIALYREI